MMTKIYTRHGDQGFTSLIYPSKPSLSSQPSLVRKNDLRIEVLGHLDELNASLGLANSFLTDTELKKILNDLQTKLFEMGSELAGFLTYQIRESATKKLEQAIDFFEEELEPLQNFIYPEGTPAAAFLHLARAVCRRTERCLVALSQKEKLNPELLKFINRLSDLLFVLARVINKRAKVKEFTWLHRSRLDLV